MGGGKNEASSIPVPTISDGTCALPQEAIGAQQGRRFAYVTAADSVSDDVRHGPASG